MDCLMEVEVEPLVGLAEGARRGLRGVPSFFSDEPLLFGVAEECEMNASRSVACGETMRCSRMTREETYKASPTDQRGRRYRV